jgi:hypothetical protein
VAGGRWQVAVLSALPIILLTHIHSGEGDDGEEQIVSLF